MDRRVRVMGDSFDVDGRLVSHGLAGFGAALAGLCAAPAVLHGVAAAFRATAFASVPAKSAYRLHLLTAPGDGRGGKAADVGAFQIQRDAARHRLGIRLLQAGCSTLQTCCSALIARLQTCFMILDLHRKSP